MLPVPLREQAIVRDGLIRAGDLARLLGCTPTWLCMLSAEGHIPKAVDGYYPLGQTVRRFSRYYRRKVHQKAQRFKKTEIALMEARTRLIELRCDEMERRIRRRRSRDFLGS